MLTATADPAPDVFLCHNSQDKAAVRIINEILRQGYGLRTYLDEATLVGGDAWEQAIQGALARATACAVIVGPHGWGRYQLEHEVRPALQRRDRDTSFRVIPVLLPGAHVEALTDCGDFFSRTHWITFTESADDVTAIRALTFALAGQNAFPEGAPRLTPSRVRFDAIRWDTGGRRDVSLLYTGQALRDAAALASVTTPPPVADFLDASRRHHNQGLARQLAVHATVMWGNPRRRDLAARLALESVRRMPTGEGMEVLRHAYSTLHRATGTLTHPAAVVAAARGQVPGTLATGCMDGSVLAWDGSTLRVLGTHGGPVRAVADLGDGRFVSAADDGTWAAWRWDTGERVITATAGAAIEALDVRRVGDRTLLLTSAGRAGHPGDVIVWNTDDGSELWRAGMAMDAVFDASGASVALAWGDHVALRRTADGELMATLPMNATVISVAAHPAQPWVAAVTFDRRAHLISFATTPPDRRDLASGISRVSPIRISPDGRYVAAVQDDFHVMIRDLSDWTSRRCKYEGLMGVDVRFSDDTRYLAVISPEATAITVWRADDGEHVCTIEQDAAAVAVFDDRRNSLWAASHRATATLFQMPRQSESYSTATPGMTTALAYGPGGALAWCGSPVGADLGMKRGDFALWVADPLTGRTHVDSKLTEPGELAFDAGGTRLAVVAGQSVRVWELSTGQEIVPVDAPFWEDHATSADAGAGAALLSAPAVVTACEQRGRVKTLTSSDGRFVAIDHGRQLVSVWNVATITQVFEFSTVAPVTRMTFSNDGALFATGDDRGGVMWWQTDGVSLGQVKHDEPIAHLVFSPDGHFLAVASMDAALRVWIASPRLLAEYVSRLVSGPLSNDDWTRYLGDEPREG